jgi:hypothetical protein
MSDTKLKSDILSRWFAKRSKTIRQHNLVLLAENEGGREDVIDELRQIVRSHYVSPAITAKRIAELGAPKTAKLLQEHLPITKTARSGDLGEILATEIAERHLEFKAPIRRLQWKDGRNTALRGDDLVALKKSSPLTFLKGESKSRAALAQNTVDEAAEALDRDSGRPSRLSVLFVAERLRQLGEDALAKELEEASLQSFRTSTVEHLLFTLSGNDPETHLDAHLTACRRKRCRHAIGVHIKALGTFIKHLYSKL